MENSEKRYDVFLSHNSKDKIGVIQIASWLKDVAKLNVWLDIWNLIPGDSWQEDLEAAIDDSRCCVIFIGPESISPWQNIEMRNALNIRTKEKAIRVVPVLLPGAEKEEKESLLPRFLRMLTWVKFESSVDEDQALYLLKCGILGIPPGSQEPMKQVSEIVNPFKGLEIFKEEDSKFFFGREPLVQQLKVHLEKYNFLAVIGPSGSGKSSILQAGLIPELRLSVPFVAIFTPSQDPIEELAIAIYQIQSTELSLEVFRDQLRVSKEAEMLYLTTRQITDSKKKLLILIDQFEELFTLTEKETDRVQFVNLLLRATRNKNVFVVLTMRSDFIGKCAFYQDLNVFINDHLIQIGPMTENGIREAIVQPARLVGLKFEEGLVEQIISDVDGASSELPLIEFALYELWNKRNGVFLTHNAYQSIGGVDGALINRAEEEYSNLGEKEKEILQKMFVLRLIQQGEGTEDTRRRAKLEELLAVGNKSKQTEEIVRRWTSAGVRLLTSFQDPLKKEAFIDVSHEALIRKWARLKGWIDNSRVVTRLIGQLRQAATEWLDSKEDETFLAHGTRLVQMQELLDQFSNDLTENEVEFIKASIELRKTKQQKERWRQKEEIKRAKMLSAALEREFENLKIIGEAQTREIEVANKLAETQQRELENAANLSKEQKKRNRLYKGVIWSSGVVILLILGFFAILYSNYRTSRDELAVNFFRNSIQEANAHDLLKAVFYGAQAYNTSSDVKLGKDLNLHMTNLLPSYRLSTIVSAAGLTLVQFNKARDLILLYSADGTGRIWSVKTGQQVGVSMKHEKVVLGAVFDKSEDRVLSWSWDGTVRIWSARTGQQVGVSLKHEKFVLGAVFDKSEDRVLTWSADGTVRIWSVKTGQQVGVSMKHEKSVYGAVFDKSEDRVLSWSEDSTVRIWSVKTGQQVGVSMKHEGSLSGAVFDKSEDRVLSWSGDGTVRIWSVKTGQQVGVSMKHEKSVYGAVFDKSEDRVLSWSWDGTLRIWSARTGQQVGVSMKHEDWIYGAVFDKSQDRVLSWSGDGTVRIWSVMTGQQVGVSMKHEKGVVGAVFDKSEDRVLSWSYDGTVRIWSVKTGQQVGVSLKHEGRVSIAVFDESEDRVLSWSYDNTVRIWSVNTGQQVGVPMKHGNGVLGAVFNKSEDRVLSWSYDNTVRIWSVKTGQQVGVSMMHERNVHGAVFDKSEDWVLSWAEDGTVRIWSARTGQQVGVSMKHEDSVKGAVFDESEDRVLSWSYDNTVRIWSVKTRQQVGVSMKHEGIVSAVFDKPENRVLSWSEDGTIRIWSVKTGQQVGVSMKHEKSVYGAVFDKSESRVLSWSYDGTVRIWSARTGQQLGVSMKHEGSLSGAVFDKSEDRVLSWSYDGTVRIWSVKTGQQVGVSMKHEDSVKGAVFDESEDRVLSWSYDGTVRIWSARTGQQLGVSMKHEKDVVGAVFDKSEDRVLSWSSDGTVRIWSVKTGQQVGVPMKHENGVVGAVFNKSEDRVLSWSYDGILQSFVLADYDLPRDLALQQLLASTGVELNLVTDLTEVLDAVSWRKIDSEFYRDGREHFLNCKFPKSNFWGKCYYNEARQLRPEIEK